VQISRPGFDAIPPGSFRDLVDALHDLYLRAGCPASRVVSSSIYRNRTLEVVSHETYRAALRGTYLLSWPKYHSIIVDLNQRTRPSRDETELLAEFQSLWARAQRENHRPPRARETMVPTSRAGRSMPSPPGSDADVSWPVLSLPDRNPTFTGRRAALGRIRTTFEQHTNATVVLHGVNGAGKTQLAAEYAHRYGDGYPVVWWVRCSGVDQARAALADLAARLGMGNGPPVDRSLTALRRYLSSPDVPHLLVFDGVEDRAIRGLIPNGGGHVILTTTDRELAYDTTMIEVEVLDFPPDEAREFLARRLPDITESQKADVIDLVGRLPLALDIAALLDPAALHALYAPSDPVVTALRAARDGLSAEYQDVCDLFGWFGPAPVPIALLQRAGTTIPPPLGDTLRSPIELRRTLRSLANFGLIRLNEHQVEMTPLARRALREILPDEASTRARNQVHEILATAGLGSPGAALAKDYREIGAHILPARLVESRNPDAQRLVVDQIRFRALDGDLAGAADLGRAAVTTWQKPSFLGSDHELVLRVQVELAGTLRGLGAYPDARALTTAALRNLQTSPAYGPDHELTLAAVAGSATDLIISGRYGRAVAANRENYDRSLAVLGAAHPRTADCRRHLAASLRHAGSYAEAAGLDQPDFDRLQAADEGFETIRVAFALAEDLSGLGQYHRALEVLTQYAPTGSRLFGDSDSGVLAAGRATGVAKRRLGQPGALTELAELYERCLEIFERSDPQMLAVTISYANALREAGGTTDAERLTVDAIEDYRTRLTDRHPLTIAARVNLAAVHRAQGRWPAAREIGQRTAEQLRRTLGASHPHAIAAAVNHATDLSLAGDRAGAVSASRAVYALASRALGPLHPDTLAAGTNLTLDLLTDGTPDDGLRERMLTAWRALLGEHEFVARLARGNRVECDIEPMPL